MTSTERLAARELLRRLASTAVGQRFVLAGSSGLYAASDTLPALTEDYDFLVDADWLADHEADVLDAMTRLGFRHERGSCTFIAEDGMSLDLIGYSVGGELQDCIAGGAVVRVMTYADLGEIMTQPGAAVDVPGGGRALSAAALSASKLLTVRLEKGSKDKLQALLLIDEHSKDPGFLEALRGLLARFPDDRLQDALADAQAASLALSSDPMRADSQSAGYAALREASARGLSALQRLVPA
ncbi:MAG: hypothetical protein JXO72_03415 [Vicinamibacteria bacterium]|nr:hypothetical protein [Vicinamibacteria bacterium]